MEERSVIHNTFVIERNYAATPERVFAAFADPAKKRRWFLDGEGHQVEQFEMDFRVGGAEHASLRFTKEDTPVTGMVCSNHTGYADIVPNRRVVTASTMMIGGQRISVSLATVELLPAGKGTDLILTHQAAFFEGADGPQMREEGWRGLLDRLAAELAR